MKTQARSLVVAEINLAVLLAALILGALIGLLHWFAPLPEGHCATAAIVAAVEDF